jgi:two-component system OmpR family sensor kinase
VLAVTIVALAGFDFSAVTALRRYLVDQADTQLNQVVRLYQPEQEVTWVGTLGTQVRATIRPPLRSVNHRRQGKVVGGKGKLTGIPWTVAGPIIQFSVPRQLGPYYVAYQEARTTRPSVLVRGNASLVPRLPANLARLAAARVAVTVASQQGRGVLRLVAARADRGTVVATTSLAGIDSTVDQLAEIVAIGSAVAALIAAAGVTVIVRRGLRPIESMAAQADRITAGDLTDRVAPGEADTEVGRLGAALNGMLGRIEASVAEREASQELTRRFFADASHELRTPLASLRANAELYQQGALPQREQVDEAMRRITLEAQRMGRLVDDMLRLARLDQAPGQRRDPVDLTEVLLGSAERSWVSDPERSWRTEIAPDLHVTGDEELLRRAVDNLLANVSTHTPAGTTATVTAARRDAEITIEVADDGPGVPDGELPRVFDRFWRAPAVWRPGSGLGLAIVAAVATTHNGTARADANDPGGLRVTLTLPAASRAEASEPAEALDADGLAAGTLGAPAVEAPAGAEPGPGA